MRSRVCEGLQGTGGALALRGVRWEELQGFTWSLSST